MDLLREAELIAAIAEVIQRDGFEYSDDETYLEFARQMRDAATELADAVRNKDYDAARAANSTIEKTCSGCHSGYRS
jgi:cytochrome c556